MPGFFRLAAAAIGLIAILRMSYPAEAATANELYQSQTIVTGTGDVNRQIGFKDCLDKVLVKVSGDQRLTQIWGAAPKHD